MSKNNPPVLNIIFADTWLFALCALATEKQVRGDFLIGNVERISDILAGLDHAHVVNLHIAMRRVPGGFFSDTVAGWMGQLQFAGYIGTDIYEKKHLKISPEVHVALLRSINSKICFADRTNGEFEAVAFVAGQLGQANVLKNMIQSVDQRIKFLCNSERDPELLKVLVPLTCMSLYNSSQSTIHPGISLKINRHRTGCYFCKKYLGVVDKDGAD